MEHTNMERTVGYHGGMVAFEGPADIVSTQLRLLPPSSQVMILPDLEHYMKMEHDRDFTVRNYVKEVHEAAQARHEIALKFLGDSSRGNKRLVFLNGGTAGAVAQCISAISRHRTAGDSLHAEMILREVLREGVQGLDQEEKDCHLLPIARAESVGTRDGCQWDDDDIEEDQITRAMRAADALYEETESLEPIECFIRTRPRSLSVPMLGWSGGAGEASPFFVFGPPPIEEEEFDSSFQEEVQTESVDQFPKRHTLMRASTQCSQMTIPMTYRPSSLTGRSFIARSVTSRSHTRNHSSTSNTMLSPPMSPSEVEFGEARLVPMQTSKKSAQSLRRTRSLDDMELHRARMRRRSDSDPLPAAPEEAPAPPTSEVKGPCRHLSILEDPFSNNNLIRLPRAKFVRANTTTIRKSPTFSKPPYNSLNSLYEDPDTQSEAKHTDKGDRPDFVRDTVLPFHEDLVIQFTGEISNHILDSVIESLQGGLYPVSTLPLDIDGTAETESCPSTPRTADLFDTDGCHGGLSPVVEVPSIDDSVDFDARSTSGLSRASNFRFHSPCPSLPPDIQPPTPAHTPPILGTDADGKRSRFQVVSTIDRVNAIAIQNNLRSILDAQFPPEQDRRYRLSRFSLLPQMDKLWRPLLWNAGTKGRLSSDRTADLILAIGAQNSVKSDFVSTLTGQVEKLGSKSTGMTRSGRLDLRFLVANAMQSFTTQSLANQLQENPFESPHLLACLIVPHLATYLSVNASTRLLILEYTAEHLATVVALQNLIGVEILKIAGIIDSEAASAYNTEPSSPVTSYHSSRLSGESTTSNSAAQLARSLDAISLPGSPFPHPFPLQGPFGARSTLAQRRRLSFSKANYVLTNTATDAEIASFIHIIRKTLIDADPFYFPEQGTVLPTRSIARYPSTKRSNGSLVSSKFAHTSTAPSTPLTTTGAASSIINQGYPHWGMSGTLVSPPSSRGSGADPVEHHMSPMTPSSRHTVLAHQWSHEESPYAPPLIPIPPPPSSSWSRDGSPSGASFRSARSRGRVGTSGHNSPNSMQSGHTSPASPEPPVANSLSPSATTPATFSLRSKSLNRILAARRGRKASGGTAASHIDDHRPSVDGRASSSTAATFVDKGSSPIRDPLPHQHGLRGMPSGGDLKSIRNSTATSAYAFSVVEEGEFYDEEERRLMPMYMRESEIRKGNSRKALKWLGLA